MKNNSFTYIGIAGTIFIIYLCILMTLTYKWGIEVGKASVTDLPRIVETRYIVITPEPTVIPTPTPTQAPSEVAVTPDVKLDTKEVEELAKMLYGEARGVSDDAEVAKCAWVALNRVDCDYYPDDLLKVLSQSGQFHGYKSDYPVTDRMYAIAEVVLNKYYLEKQGFEVDRELEHDYLYFHGDGVNNYFKKSI